MLLCATSSNCFKIEQDLDVDIQYFLNEDEK